MGTCNAEELVTNMFTKFRTLMIVEQEKREVKSFCHCASTTVSVIVNILNLSSLLCKLVIVKSTLSSVMSHSHRSGHTVTQFAKY